MRRAEVVAPRGINQTDAHFWRSSLEQTDVGHAVEQIARLARLHLTLLKHVVVEKMVETRLLYAQAARVCGAFENLDLGRGAWRLYARTVSHTAKEGFVNQIFLVEVRRKDDELLERHFDLLARVQRQIVNALL